jgi:hypothetical protein
MRMGLPMREERVYDDGRRVVWPEALRPAEVAVFYVDAESGRYRTPEGLRIASHWDRTCTVARDLDEARRHARAVVERAPGVACRICAAADPGTPIEVVRGRAEARRGDPKRARRLMAWGVGCLALGVAGIAIDWYFDWFYLLGVVIGTKFLIVGVARFVEGVAEWHAVRSSALESGELVGVADEVEALDPGRPDVDRHDAVHAAVDRQHEARLAVDLDRPRGE